MPNTLFTMPWTKTLTQTIFYKGFHRAILSAILCCVPAEAFAISFHVEQKSALIPSFSPPRPTKARQITTRTNNQDSKTEPKQIPMAVPRRRIAEPDPIDGPPSYETLYPVGTRDGIPDPVPQYSDIQDHQPQLPSAPEARPTNLIDGQFLLLLTSMVAVQLWTATQIDLRSGLLIPLGTVASHHAVALGFIRMGQREEEKSEAERAQGSLIRCEPAVEISMVILQGYWMLYTAFACW